MSETKWTPGDEVTWTSQAQGSAVTKRGTVVAVIPAGADYRDYLTSSLKAMARGWGLMPRSSESYVVHAPSPSGRGAGKLYWPHAGLLRAARKSKEDLMRAAAPELYEALEDMIEEIVRDRATRMVIALLKGDSKMAEFFHLRAGVIQFGSDTGEPFVYDPDGVRKAIVEAFKADIQSAEMIALRKENEQLEKDVKFYREMHSGY